MAAPSLLSVLYTNNNADPVSGTYTGVGVVPAFAAGSARKVVALIGIFGTGNVTAASIGGAALTQVEDQAASSGGRTEAWELLEADFPAGGPHHLVITGTSATLAVCLLLFGGARQAFSTVTVGTNAGSTTSTTGTLADVPADSVMVYASSWASNSRTGTSSNPSGNVERYDAVAAGGSPNGGLVVYTYANAALASRAFTITISGAASGRAGLAVAIEAQPTAELQVRVGGAFVDPNTVAAREAGAFAATPLRYRTAGVFVET